MSTAIAKNFQIGADSTPSNNFTLYQPASPDGTLRLGNGNTGITSSLLTLTSAGNLGIGTSSPAFKLDVIGTLRSTGEARFDNAINLKTATLNQVYFDDAVAFTRNGTGERMRIDSSGNLGLGVTPSAWGTASSRRAIELPGGGNIWGQNFGGGNPSMQVYCNAYESSTGARYVNSAQASGYQQNAGSHAWFTAPSGTAGNAISFTQAMTLDASGNLGIGTSSPTGGRLHVVQTTGSAIFGTTAGGTGYGGNFENTDGGTTKFVRAAGAGGNGVFAAGVGATTQLLLDTSGNFHVGTTTTAGRLSVGGKIRTLGGDIELDTGQLTTNSSANPLRLGVDGVERARIDSSGNLLVGATAGSCHKLYKSASDSYAVVIENGTTGNPYGLQIAYPGRSGLSTINELYLRCNDVTSTRMYVMSNGGIGNFSGNNANLSDRREKTNFAPAGSYLDKICAIPVQTYNYIDQDMEQDPDRTLGVVAQDVQAVAPELVTESDWSAEKDGSKMRLSIYQTDLQYALMKALQELKAEFDAYKATHP